MTALRNYKMPWTEVYDTTELIAKADLQNGAPLYVDIGGAHGLDIERLLARHPDLLSGVLVVQDTPEVVVMTAEKLYPCVQKMACDFFTPKPLVEARAYFFHAVPHDWPDADMLRMLANVSECQECDEAWVLETADLRSRVASKGGDQSYDYFDLQLMNCVSGPERTEQHWRELLKTAGFEVDSISRYPRAVESVTEAVWA
jgi:hypothetical protein